MSERHKYTFFTDRNLGKQFPNILKENGIAVERHFDHFADNATDEEWLSEIGKRGWYVLTHDQRIRYKPNEKEAVRIHGIGMFVLIGKVPFPELAGNFVATYPRILRFIKKHPPPFIAKIYRSTKKSAKKQAGIVQMWESFE